MEAEKGTASRLEFGVRSLEFGVWSLEFQKRRAWLYHSPAAASERVAGEMERNSVQGNSCSFGYNLTKTEVFMYYHASVLSDCCFCRHLKQGLILLTPALHKVMYMLWMGFHASIVVG